MLPAPSRKGCHLHILKWKSKWHLLHWGGCVIPTFLKDMTHYPIIYYTTLYYPLPHYTISCFTILHYARLYQNILCHLHLLEWGRAANCTLRVRWGCHRQLLKWGGSFHLHLWVRWWCHLHLWSEMRMPPAPSLVRWGSRLRPGREWPWSGNDLEARMAFLSISANL